MLEISVSEEALKYQIKSIRKTMLVQAKGPLCPASFFSTLASVKSIGKRERQTFSPPLFQLVFRGTLALNSEALRSHA